MTEEDARGLCELAAVDLRMAKGFAERALAEEDPDVANGLARSYQRAARSYRQTLALKARLRRDLMRGAREDRADALADDFADAPVARHVTRLAADLGLASAPNSIPRRRRLMINPSRHGLLRPTSARRAAANPTPPGDAPPNAALLPCGRRWPAQQVG